MKIQYRSLDEIRADIDKFGIELPILEDLGPLKPNLHEGSNHTEFYRHTSHGRLRWDSPVDPVTSPTGDMKDLPGVGLDCCGLRLPQ